MTGSDGGKDAYFLGQAKNNLGPKVEHSIKYHIESAHVGHDDELNEAIWSSRIVVDGYTDQRIDVIDQEQENRKTGGRETALSRAVRWLKEYLEEHGGSAPSAEVKAAAEDAEHSDRTLKRAVQKLGVVIDNGGVVGGGRNTLWSLPNLGPTDLTGPTGPTGPTGLIDQSSTERVEITRSGQSGQRANPPREVARPLGPTSCRQCGDPDPGELFDGLCFDCDQPLPAADDRSDPSDPPSEPAPATPEPCPYHRADDRRNYCPSC